LPTISITNHQYRDDFIYEAVQTRAKQSSSLMNYHGSFYGKTPRMLRFLRFLYHLPNFIRLAWRLFMDARVPIHRKAILVLFELLAVAFAVFYFWNPFDLDFIPVIGKLDDFLIGSFVILVPGSWMFIKLCPEDIVREHVERLSQGE
jgi:uncharacterized membrane protein YkvA (DUF1232 family)